MEQIDAGAVERIYNHDTSHSPVLQVMDVKRIGTQSASNTQERYRLVLSDTRHYQQAMLATQLNELVNNGSLEKHCIVRLNDYICNMVQGRRIVIVLALEIVQGPTPNVLGSPVSIESAVQGGGLPANTAAPTSGAQPVGIQHGGAMGAPPQPMKTENTVSYAKPVTSTGDQGPIHPIPALNPYQNKWTIKARVIRKGDIRTWNNERGSGKLFSVDLMDKDGEIRATFFKEGVDRFHDMIQQDKVYLFSGGQIKIANKKFSSLKNEYEITMDARSEVTTVEDTGAMPTVRFAFTSLDKLSADQKDEIVDVIGVVTEVKDVQQIVARASGKTFEKRDVVLADMSKTAVAVTLWGSNATSFDPSNVGSVLALKGVKVSDFNGVSLSAMQSTYVSSNPDIPEGHQLRGWWDSSGHAESMVLVSGTGPAGGGSRSDPRKTLIDIQNENLGSNEKPDYFVTKATINFIRSERDMWYIACPNETCNKKKLMQQMDGTLFCERCQQSTSAPLYRYVASMNIQDHTDKRWVSMFNEVGEKVFGEQAQALHEWKEAADPKYHAALRNAIFRTYMFKIRASVDHYQDQQRVRLNVLEARDIDFVADTREMLEELKI